MKFDERFHQAIREGRKTQTRRPVKPQPETDTDCPYHVGQGRDRKARKQPYGRNGDTLQIAPDLTIRITAVRVERLQEMEHTDAFAEGFPKGIGPLIGGGSFADAWDRFYPDPPHNWASNPWCWVYEFERCK